MQDPRKEVVTLRGLFTQTVALRLRSADETRMVLGDGTAAEAPAHRISPAAPGTAWVVDEDGTADRVRADYWSDALLRQVAAAHPAPVVESFTRPAPAPTAATAPMPTPAEETETVPVDVPRRSLARVQLVSLAPLAQPRQSGRSASSADRVA